MLGNLLGGFIVIIIGANLIGPVAMQIQTAKLNTTATVDTVLDLVPLFFALGIMSAGVAITVGGLRNAGVM